MTIQDRDLTHPVAASEPAATRPPEIHPVDQKPPFTTLFFLGLQHVLAMYAGAVAVPLIVGGALVQAGRLNSADIHHLIVADLFVAGVASILQSVGWWRFGARLPLIQGVSFVSVAPMIAIGNEFGITAIYGSVITTGLAMMLIAPFFAQIARYLPTLVIGTIVMIVGLTLTSVAAGWILNNSAPPAEQGRPSNFILALVTLLAILLFHRYVSAMLRPMAVLFGILVGTILAQLMGATSWSGVSEAAWVAIPKPMQFGLPTFELSAMLTMLIVGLVIMTETTGDIVSIGKIVGKPTSGRILADGLRADGFSTLLGGLFNTFPYTAFAQNVGLVSLSKVRSRYIVTVAGGILILLGLLPKLGGIIAAIPAPVLGGAGIALFGMVTISGVRTLCEVQWNETRALIVAVSVSIALLPSVAPTIYDNLPKPLELILHSGIASGAICIIVLNLLLNREDGAHRNDTLAAS